MHVEYHELFQNSEQPTSAQVYTLKVTGLKNGASLPAKMITANDITKLINPRTGMFVTEMHFDDWLLPIAKIDIDLTSKIVSIVIV